MFLSLHPQAAPFHTCFFKNVFYCTSQRIPNRILSEKGLLQSCIFSIRISASLGLNILFPFRHGISSAAKQVRRFIPQFRAECVEMHPVCRFSYCLAGTGAIVCLTSCCTKDQAGLASFVSVWLHGYLAHTRTGDNSFTNHCLWP